MLLVRLNLMEHHQPNQKEIKYKSKIECNHATLFLLGIPMVSLLNLLPFWNITQGIKIRLNDKYTYNERTQTAIRHYYW